ncbi:MAG: hypothetical protein ACK4NC_06660 [Candidatus Gracilibacteria bacterium]
MTLEGIDTQELIQNAKADASSFIIIVAVLVISFFIAWIISRSFDKYLEEHLSDALWLQENRRKVKLFIRAAGTLLLTIMILSLTSVFSELSWILAPLTIALVYMNRKTLQNIAEHFALIFEGKIQLLSFLHITNPAVKIDASGKIYERNSRRSFFNTVDGGEIIIRNHDLFEAIIKNYARSPIRRISIEMEFPIIHKIADIDETVINVIKNNEHALTQYPIDPLLTRINDGNYYYDIHFWVSKDETNMLQMKQNIKKEIYREVCTKNFGLPYLHEDTSYSLS